METKRWHRKLAGIQEIWEEWREPGVMVHGDVTGGGWLPLNFVRKRNVATVPEVYQCPPLDGHLLCLAVTSWLPQAPLQRSIVHFDGDPGLVTSEVRWHPKAREGCAGTQAAVLFEPSCVELKWKGIGLSLLPRQHKPICTVAKHCCFTNRLFGNNLTFVKYLNQLWLTAAKNAIVGLLKSWTSVFACHWKSV